MVKYEQNSKYLKILTVTAAILGVIIYLFAVPYFGSMVAEYAPEFSYCFWPWVIFIWITAIPVGRALFLCFMLATDLGCGRAFSLRSAKSLKGIADCAVIDSALFLLGNIVYLLLGINHPSIFIFSLFICFIGLGIFIVGKTLSQLISEAHELKSENESYI